MELFLGSNFIILLATIAMEMFVQTLELILGHEQKDLKHLISFIKIFG